MEIGGKEDEEMFCIGMISTGVCLGWSLAYIINFCLIKS